MSEPVAATEPSHRPYPPPRGPWAVEMVWHDLLFMHWPVPAEALRGVVPAGLEIDTYRGGPWRGRAFIAVVPFWMSGVRARCTPAVPGLSTTPELNVRTYVRPSAGGQAGIYFFSLDAASRLAVRGARLLYKLPYFDARMRCERGRDGWIGYESERTHRGAPRAGFAGRYRPAGSVAFAGPGTLESFLTDRYCLYTTDGGGRLYRCEIDHAPWPLRPAEAEVARCTMAEPLGIRLAGPAPLLHFSERIRAVAWGLRRVPGAGR